MSAAPMIDAQRLSLMLGELRLPTIKHIWGDFAAQADKEGWPASRFLAALAEHELAERDRRRIERHLAEAHLPAGKTLACFAFDAVPMISKAQVMALCAGDGWLEQGANLILFGPPGGGKTHLAAAIGLALVERGWRVLFTRTSDLVQRLQVARRELALESAMTKLDKYHLLILDDFAYVSRDQAETSVLFELRIASSSLSRYTLAALNAAPIAATALAGAVLLILLRVITADEAYSGLKPQILVLIAGMVVIGIAMEESGLADAASEMLIASVYGLSPLIALIVLYLVTMVLTELLSNATVAVLITPVAVALAESLAVSPRPFLVAVMMAASAAFATPFGYQTNVIVYQMGGYRYMDFVRVGLPLNLITCVAAILAIQRFFPF